MKVLVVIFAILGMLGTGAIGAVLLAVQPELADKKGELNEKMADLRELVKDTDDIEKSDKEEILSDLDQVDSVIRALETLHWYFLGAAFIGLVTMVLSLANVGPRPLHGVLFIAAGILPVVMTYDLVRGVARIVAISKKFGGVEKGGFSPEDVNTILVGAAIASVGLVIAGVFAFLVKRKPPEVAGVPAAYGAMPPPGYGPPPGGGYDPPPGHG